MNSNKQTSHSICKNCKHCEPIYSPMLSDKCELTGDHVSLDGTCNKYAPTKDFIVIDALQKAETFVDCHSEDWYKSGQSVLIKIREAIKELQNVG